ncbi:MAG: DNA recombination protein RmuC [Phascolarctobacterium sp.]
MPLEQILLLASLGITLVLALLVFLLWRKLSQLEQVKPEDAVRKELEQQLFALKQDLGLTIQGLGNNNMQSITQLSQLLQDNQKIAMDAQRQQLEQMEKSMRTKQENMLFILKEQLEEIRGTVDEKLQTTLEKRITESFKTVSSQLEQVYKGLGEMQSLASDVGGLKKIMSGVKTRGNLGEYQLAGILAEILAPEQYDTNVATVPKSSERVEFAVKLPHEDGTIYLPIDSKFPAETYMQLRDAQESGDRKAVEAAYKNLEAVIKSEAKDIRTKYVAVPYTTNFAIMFLPAEGLYAEVVSRGMVETLQRDYQVNVAGPSTMAALLNSLQMGFKTLAIQQKSNYAWEVLGAVKTEFEKFGEGLKKMQSHLDMTSKDLDALITTRTNQMQRKLRDVERLDELKAAQLLELTAKDNSKIEA